MVKCLNGHNTEERPDSKERQDTEDGQESVLMDMTLKTELVE